MYLFQAGLRSTFLACTKQEGPENAGLTSPWDKPSAVNKNTLIPAWLARKVAIFAL